MQIPMWVPRWIYYTEIVRVGKNWHVAHYWLTIQFIEKTPWKRK